MLNENRPRPSLQYVYQLMKSEFTSHFIRHNGFGVKQKHLIGYRLPQMYCDVRMWHHTNFQNNNSLSTWSQQTRSWTAHLEGKNDDLEIRRKPHKRRISSAWEYGVESNYLRQIQANNHVLMLSTSHNINMVSTKLVWTTALTIALLHAVILDDF